MLQKKDFIRIKFRKDVVNRFNSDRMIYVCMSSPVRVMSNFVEVDLIEPIEISHLQTFSIAWRRELIKYLIN